MKPALRAAAVLLVCAAAARAAEPVPVPLMRRGAVVLTDPATAAGLKPGDRADVFVEESELAAKAVAPEKTDADGDAKRTARRGDAAARLRDGKLMLAASALVLDVRPPGRDAPASAALLLAVSPDDAQFLRLAPARGLALAVRRAPER